MVKNGIDNIKEYDSLLKGKRIGLITSISGVDSQLVSTIDRLYEKYELVALFSPEHGVRGNVGAGEMVENEVDPYTKVPVYSLYRSDSKRLTKEMLDKVDSIVYDIQDVGTRYYTFISTMYYAMQECEVYNKEMIVLDRINPLGDKVEGNVLDSTYKSFVGAYPICMRYGLTVGELGKMIYEENQYHFPFHIIPIKNWERTMLFSETGLPWAMPSLGIPRFETALMYAGTCLFEGTNVSEGRGTSAPFEIIGAPYIDGYRLAKYMNEKKLSGVVFSPIYFTPSCSKYEGKACEGVHVHITNNKEFNAVETGMTLLYTIRTCYETDFEFLPPVRKDGKCFIDLLAGTKKLRDETISLDDILHEFEKDRETFRKRKESFHLYK